MTIIYRFYKNIILFVGFFGLANIAYLSHAEMPYVLEKGQKSYTLMHVSESFDSKWLGGVKSPIAQISQQTTWLGMAYGLTDRLQLQFDTGYTQSKFDASDVRFSGVGDSRVGLKYFLLNEATGKPISLAIKSTAIIKGRYERSFAGNPHSPGDKANGLEMSFPFSRNVGALTLMGDVGYRVRADDVPDDAFYSFGLGWHIKRVFIQTRFQKQDGQGGLDIGVAPFTPNDFHRTEEDRSIVDVGLSYDTPYGFALFTGLGGVISGRNTGDSNIYYLGIYIN